MKKVKNLFMARLALVIATLALVLQVFAALVKLEPNTRKWVQVHIWEVACPLAPEWVMDRQAAIATLAPGRYPPIKPCRQ